MCKSQVYVGVCSKFSIDHRPPIRGYERYRTLQYTLLRFGSASGLALRALSAPATQDARARGVAPPTGTRLPRALAFM